MRRLTWIGITLSLLAATALPAACGGDSSPQGTSASPTDPQQAEREYDLDATGQSAAEQLGGHAAAAYAVLKSADNGYSPYQAAAAIHEQLLDPSGVIEGVAPAGPAGNLLSGRDETALPRVASVAAGVAFANVVADEGGAFTERSDFEQMFAKLDAAGNSGPWLTWVLTATGAGYSVRQITEALGREAADAHRAPPPPSWGGVAVIRDANDDVVVPELGADWPYRGRNILNEVRQDPDLDFDDNLAVLVIGLVNAGYTAEQIEEAVRWDRIAACLTADGTAVALGCIDEAGELVPPASVTPGSHPPGRVVISDITTLWPRGDATGQGTAGQGAAGEDVAAKFQSGQPVSLKLTPYLASKDTGLKITKHEVIMDLAPAEIPSFAYITCRWRIELVQETADGQHAQGTTFVCEGEAYDEEGDAWPISGFRRKHADYSYTAFTPAGEHSYTVTDSGLGFAANLDEFFEGHGHLIGGPAGMNWDTFPGVLPD